MNTTAAKTATTTAPMSIGAKQFGKTLPAGSTVKVRTITTDGQFAYVCHGLDCGYISVSALVY